jgi:hypothetical protein
MECDVAGEYATTPHQNKNMIQQLISEPSRNIALAVRNILLTKSKIGL